MGYRAPSAEDIYRYLFRLDNYSRSLTDGFCLSIIFVNDDSPVCQDLMEKDTRKLDLMSRILQEAGMYLKMSMLKMARPIATACSVSLPELLRVATRITGREALVQKSFAFTLFFPS